MNKKVITTIKIIGVITTILIIGKIIIESNPIYKFKVEALLKSKECKVTSYRISSINKYEYCSNISSELESCLSKDMSRKISFEGNTDCYEYTTFEFLIFRKDDNKIISKGYFAQREGSFGIYQDTSISNVGDSYISCRLESSYSDCSDDEYQVLFK